MTPIFDVRDRLSTITAPTLILVGVKDFICSEKMARALHEGIRGSLLVSLPRSGHLGHVEEPREHAQAIGAFLASLPPP